MDIKQLKTFICVAETGSLSRASDRLRIAQPALSRQIKLLEHEVGVSLFDRHIHGMDLTIAGKELLSRVSGPIYQLEQSFYDVKSLNSQVSGHVTLGVLPTITEMFSVRLFEKVRDQLPGVTLCLKEAYSVNLVEWIQIGALDVAFLYGPPTAYHLRCTELFYEDIVLLSPVGALPAYGDEIDIRDIEPLPLALPSRPFGPRLIIDQIAKQAGVRLKSAFDVDSFRVISAMVQAGLCHGFMPLSSVSRFRNEGHIELRRITPGRAQRHLILARPSNQPSTRAAIAITRIIMEQIGEMIVTGAWDARPCGDLLPFLTGISGAT